MDIKAIGAKKIFKIPNVNGCTNVGGVAISSTGRMFAIKTRQDNTASCILQFPDYRKSLHTSREYSGLGHGNGLAFSSGWLAVPPCGYELHMIRVTSLDHKIYKSGTYISGVAYKGGGVWIVKSQGKLCTIQLSEEGTVKMVGSYKLQNPMAEKGFTVSQDIAYHDGLVYHIYSHKDKRQSCILVQRLEKAKAVVKRVYLGPRKPKLYEWESLDFSPDGDMMIVANTDLGDYVLEGTGWKTKEQG